MNRTLGVNGGAILHNQDMFSSPMPALDSCTNASTLMNLSINSHKNLADNPLIKSMAMDSYEKMTTPNNLDPIVDQITRRPSFGSSAGFGSGYTTLTSATALLQRAAEMGAKISDNTIAPILLRGFTGYSTSSTNVQEVSSMTGYNMAGLISFATSCGLYAGTNPEETLMNKKDDAAGDGYRQGQRNGLYDSCLYMHSANGNSHGLLGREVVMRGGEKMTLDFLGVEPTGRSSFVGKKRSYDGSSIVGVGYSNGQLTSLHSDW